jgi:hypothetical protein
LIDSKSIRSKDIRVLKKENKIENKEVYIGNPSM